MNTAKAVQAMIGFYGGSRHDISHFLKVYAYAKTIGELEGLDDDTQQTLELAAIVHDIACPLCREKYGGADGKLQEREGPPLARQLLAPLGYAPATVDRVCRLVGRHHTYSDVDGLDYRILLEADFLVNADEGSLPAAVIAAARESFFRTRAGTALLDCIYLHQ